MQFVRLSGYDRVVVYDPREFNAIVENGLIRPDEPLNLPDRTRVRIAITTALPTTAEREEALQKLLEISELGLFRSGGHRFTRIELHERD